MNTSSTPHRKPLKQSQLPRIGAILLLVSALSGCGRKEPDISIDGLTMMGVPVMLTFTNHEQRAVTIKAVTVNADRVLTTIIRVGYPKSEFRATTLAEGEMLTLDVPLEGPVNRVRVETDLGNKTFEFRD